MLYVYGIVAPDTKMPADLTGIDQEPVQVAPLGEVAALVSPLPAPDEFGAPDHLRQHSAVLDTLATQAPVLPMAFGMIVEDTEALAPQINASDRQQEYLAALERVRGAQQFTVRAAYVQDAVLAELVAENPEVSRLRDATQGQSTEATYYERIRLGELVVQELQRKAAVDAPDILQALAKFAREVRTRETGQAEEIVDAAILVDQPSRDQFEDGLEELAASMAGRARFRLIGPQAPYDFVAESS